LNRSKKYVIGVIACCLDCSFRDEDYNTGQSSGKRHHYTTGHEVHIEITYDMFYERKNNGNK